MAHRFYACHLLENGPLSPTIVELNCGNDTEAILAGRALAEPRPGCIGYEIHLGERLVYRHELAQGEPADPPSGAAVKNDAGRPSRR